MGTCDKCTHYGVCHRREVSQEPEFGCTDFADKPRWIPVTERLPEVEKTRREHRNVYRESGRVLCACLQADGKRLVKEGYMFFFNDNPQPKWAIPGTIHSVTHWMPLPEPPKEDNFMRCEL